MTAYGGDNLGPQANHDTVLKRAVLSTFNSKIAIREVNRRFSKNQRLVDEVND